MEPDNQHILRNRLWDARAQKKKESRPIDRLFERFFAKYRNALGTQVLDIGCGTGVYAVRLAQEGFSVTGIDPSEEMRRVALETAATNGLDLRILAGESTSLPLADNSIDVVVSVGAIHHNRWSGIEQSFAEISRVLRPGGYIFFQGRSVDDTVVERAPVQDYGYTARDVRGDREGLLVHYFTEQELLELGERNGFEVVMRPRKKSRMWRNNPHKHKVRISIAYRKKERTSESPPSRLG